MSNSNSDTNDTNRRGNISIDGEVDAGFSSYGVPPQDDNVVGGATGEQTGEEETVVLPESFDADELTDTQLDVIETAALRRPDSVVELAEHVDVSRSYAGRILRNEAPALHEEIASYTDDSGGAEPSSDDESDDTDDTDEPAQDAALGRSEVRSSVAEARTFAERIERIHVGRPKAIAAEFLRILPEVDE